MNLPLNRQILPLLGALVLVGGCNGADQQRTSPIANATNQFRITGMHCTGCARGLAGELIQAMGVASAGVSFTNKIAVVAYDTNRTSSARLIQVVEEAGFQVEKESR